MEQAKRAQVSSELFGVLARIVHRTAQDAATILRRDGLNPAQFQLLRMVGQSPGVTQATFAVWLPIFATSLAHAGFQLTPGRDDEPLLRAVSGPATVAYAATAIWPP